MQIATEPPPILRPRWAGRQPGVALAGFSTLEEQLFRVPQGAIERAAALFVGTYYAEQAEEVEPLRRVLPRIVPPELDVDRPASLEPLERAA